MSFNNKFWGSLEGNYKNHILVIYTESYFCDRYTTHYLSLPYAI